MDLIYKLALDDQSAITIIALYEQFPFKEYIDIEGLVAGYYRYRGIEYQHKVSNAIVEAYSNIISQIME